MPVSIRALAATTTAAFSSSSLLSLEEDNNDNKPLVLPTVCLHYTYTLALACTAAGTNAPSSPSLYTPVYSSTIASAAPITAF